MATGSGRDSDPLVTFQYRIEVSGPVAITGYFTEVSGIGSESEVVEHKVVTEDGHSVVQKIPGRLKWQDVTLKRGITSDMGCWQWRAAVEAGVMSTARANCSIIMMDTNYADLARWDFINAWPSKVTGPQAQSDANAFGVEEMTLVHEGMTRAS